MPGAKPKKPTRLTREWEYAKQLLSTLREPRKWRESILERVTQDEGHYVRQVEIKVSRKTAKAYAKRTGDVIHFVAMKPRKGEIAPITVSESSGEQLLAHSQHLRLTQIMVSFRFMSMVEEAVATGHAKAADIFSFLRLADRIAKGIVAEPMPELAKAELDTWFDAERRWFRTMPGDAASAPKLAEQMELLYRLCLEVAERYYKIIRVPRFSTTDGVIDYSYHQTFEDRTSGRVPAVRRALRAPSSAFYVHVPLARLTDHYEFRMAPIRGWYVAAQNALVDQGDDLPRQSHVRVSEDGKNAWASTPVGRTNTPTVFIGNGTAATSRLYVGLRLEEVPPGAAGHAFATHGLALIAAFGLLLWSLGHVTDRDSAAAGILAGLLALGGPVVDWLIPRAPNLNAPALPRLLLFLQAVWLILFALWLFARGTADTVRDPAEHFEQAAWLITDWEWVFGVLLVAAIGAQCFALGIRVRRSTRGYNSVNERG